ncbi:MAG: AAA ATPase [Candidatus Nomurabacteria bacterium GW2011_GWA2_40_9]|uniref:AAA ATPase n=1 Tax=Candidatus Nomurabacteria bacterium GW2011_GWA2_40_9 TaxID=1618734 RepID=A0A0G0WVF5_9BACT|nr:MAG: AAA ATPase [Candidatus Nomurabacteria bacterium GW2011_GWA2_40_9]
MTQEEALAILKTGANVFLTGEPGAGKTHTINQYASYLRERGIEPSITASTGIAATHIGGMTIHSWSGIGIRNYLDKYTLDKITTTEYLTKRIKRAKVLVIDEVSMLGPETFSMVEAVCRAIRQNNDAFGGLQVILVGDFFQLPPIVKGGINPSAQTTMLETPKARFAYDSPAWKRTNPMVCYLTEQHRQDDSAFLDLLSAIRSNNFNDNHLSQIITRKIIADDMPDKAVKLYTHNLNVDRTNDAMLETFSGHPVTFTMKTKGAPMLVETLQRGCLSPYNLILKVGAKVMFTKNNPKGGFVNGTLGTVESFDKYIGMPIIKTNDGRKITAEQMDWTIEENGKARATISQLPLRLAWAITVHKSQGMSLDEAVVDLSEVFEYGQGYVALSRVRRLKGLHLLGWNEMAFQVHPEVLKEDNAFRASSEASLTAFAQISPEELQKMQDNFVKACGGNTTSHSIPPLQGEGQGEGFSAKAKKKKGLRFGKIREKHPNAFRSWTQGQDKELEE